LTINSENNIFGRLTTAARHGVYTRLQAHPGAYARTRALLSRNPLPPGDLAILDVMEKHDRDLLNKRAA